MNILTKFIHAASYVTIIPLARLLPASTVDEESLNGLAVYLPAVGAVIGAILAVAYFVLDKLNTPNFLLATMITIIWLIVTGGLHFDGLMDTADGIFSHRNRERMLEIMQDSRVGNFAVIAGMAAFALKIAALSAITSQFLPAILLLSPCLARLAETWAIGAFPYARAEGKGKVWHDTMRFPQDLFWAAICPLILLALLGTQEQLLIPTLIYCAINFAISLGAGTYLYNRLGGHTGDTYGAVVEIAETLSLVLFAISFHSHSAAG
jgi:cobalamin 5'-phosphate synthase/cobalamin synthase